MRISELDDIEKRVLLGAVVDRARVELNGGKPLTKMRPRPGERIQTWWCEGCQDWHSGSVLGGPVGDPHAGEGC